MTIKFSSWQDAKIPWFNHHCHDRGCAIVDVVAAAEVDVVAVDIVAAVAANDPTAGHVWRSQCCVCVVKRGSVQISLKWNNFSFHHQAGTIYGGTSVL